jgi:hypothetical protein
MTRKQRRPASATSAGRAVMRERGQDSTQPGGVLRLSPATSTARCPRCGEPRVLVRASDPDLDLELADLPLPCPCGDAGDEEARP